MLTEAQSRYDGFKALERAGARTLTGARLHIMRLDGRAFSTYTRGLN